MTTQDKRPLHPGDASKPTGERELDEALKETFPASDPPAVTQGTTGIPDAIQRQHDEGKRPAPAGNDRK